MRGDEGRGAPVTKKNCVIQLASTPCIGLPTTAPSTIAVPNEAAAAISDGQIPTSIPMVGKKTCKPCIPPEAQTRPRKRKTSAGELHMVSS